MCQQHCTKTEVLENNLLNAKMRQNRKSPYSLSECQQDTEAAKPEQKVPPAHTHAYPWENTGAWLGKEL